MLPSETDPIYLDNNATTQPLPEVVDTVSRIMRDVYGNPGSRHRVGRRARQVLEDSRESVASILGADPEEVIFTSGGTEATNIALFGLAAGRNGQVLMTAGEHPATTETIAVLEKRNWRRHLLPVDREGLLIESAWEDVPWREIQLATLILAHNELGVIQNPIPLSIRCRQLGIPFHLDAVQAVGKMDIDFHALGVTTLALGAHKFHGPRGIGALLVRRGVTLPPQQYGGHQERGRRPGTESIPLIAGMARALELWQADSTARIEHLRTLRDRLQQGLVARCAPVVVNGSEVSRLPNTLNIAFPGCDGDALLVNLDLAGICCSMGSACSSGASEPAPALVAMGCPPEVYRSSLRFSVSILNDHREIDRAIELIAEVVHRLRSLSASPT